MKKLLVAAMAVALACAAEAAFYTFGYVEKYAAEDSATGSKSGFYTLYTMKQSDVRTAMGRTTAVTYSDVATWLGENFAVNRDAVIANGEAVSVYYVYPAAYMMMRAAGSDTSNSLGDAIGVFLYDDGVNVAYNVFSNGTEEDFDIESGGMRTVPVTDTFSFSEDRGSLSSGWQAATMDVPEPTSGLLMLLGLAGLALRRKQRG